MAQRGQLLGIANPTSTSEQRMSRPATARDQSDPSVVFAVLGEAGFNRIRKSGLPIRCQGLRGDPT